MADAHVHTHAHGLDARRADSARRMWWALGINVILLVAEAIAGVVTGSLALLADAGHVLSDVGGIGLALFAGALAARPADSRRTFGYQRSEVFAALINGIALIVIAVLVAVEAINRFGDPHEIEAGGVLAFGLIGLAGNVIATIVLAGGQREDVNLEGALRHSAADALGSIGVIVSGAVILATDWTPIDPLASLLISGLILASSFRLISEPLDVLMESAPAGMDVDAIAAEICRVEDVRAVHELHLWTVTAGFEALAAHVVVRVGCDRDLVRRKLEVMLHQTHGIEHTTLQMEEEAPPELLDVEGAATPRE